MASLVKGITEYCPKYFTSKDKGTPILKFVVLVNGDACKRVPVFVLGPLAKKHFDLGTGQEIMVSGEFEDNTFRDETVRELKIFWSKGNMKLIGEKKPCDNPDSGGDLSDAPEIDFTGLDDEAYEKWIESVGCYECGHVNSIEIPEEKE